MNIFDEEYAAYDEVDGEEVGDGEEANEWAVSSMESLPLHIPSVPMLSPLHLYPCATQRITADLCHKKC